MKTTVDEQRILCREEAHARALAEARVLARDDVKNARLHGAAANSFFYARLKYHYVSLKGIYT